MSSLSAADVWDWLNADNVLACLLKHGDQLAMDVLDLPLWDIAADHGQALRDYAKHLMAHRTGWEWKA